MYSQIKQEDKIMSIKLLSIVATLLMFSASARAVDIEADNDFGLDEEVVVETSDAVEDLKDTIIEKKAEALENAKAEVAEAKETVEEAVENAEEKAKETLEDAKKVAEDVVETTENKVKDAAKVKADISYYASKLNLSVEQLDMAQGISKNGLFKQEQLLKSIHLLRKQARDMEDKNLQEFEAILTDEQKEIFHKMKKEYDEGTRQKDELDDVVAEINRKEEEALSKKRAQ